MAARLKLTCALAIVALLAVAPGAFAAKGMEIAVQDDPSLFGGLYSTPQIGLGLAEKLHASRVRVNVTWSYVVGRKAAKKKKAPKHINYNWSGYDLLIANSAQYGIKVQLALAGTAPAWATGNHKIGAVKPKASAFKAFAAAAAQHFRGRVDRYSIWNEPNHRAWISPIKSGPAIYRSLYLAGYSAIKRADPSAQVLIGETSPFELGRGRNAMSPLKFLRGVACANNRYRRARRCATLKTDGYAHHPYDFDHKPTYRFPGKDNVTIGVLPRLTSALSKLARAKLLTTPSGGVPEVYLTEYGYFSSGKRKVSPPKHGRYLVQAFTIAQRDPHVREMLHYLLVKPLRRFAFFDTSLASRRGATGIAFKMLAAWARRVGAAGGIAVTNRPGGGGPANGPPEPPPGGGQPPSGGGGGGSTPNCTVVAGIPICQ
jgi:hypothetical protein